MEVTKHSESKQSNSSLEFRKFENISNDETKQATSTIKRIKTRQEFL